MTRIDTAAPRHVEIFVSGQPLNGNAIRRQNRFAIRRDTEQFKTDTILLARDAMNKAGIKHPFRQARLHVHFQWRDKRRRDLDNAIAGLKPIIDGLVGIVLTDDDVTHLEFGTVRGLLGWPRTGVSLTIEEVTWQEV